MENRKDPRLSPDAWVDAAYAAFEDGGVAAIRVDPLARKLGITRGSFYWHFKDRNALLRAVVGRWQTTSTEQEIDANEAAGGPPAERLLRLLRSCASDDGRFEISIRAWATEDDEVG
ncbi:MAG: TetR/AcrR family transcriptional regulator, partial [Pseudomonadota bacterium]